MPTAKRAHAQSDVHYYACIIVCNVMMTPRVTCSTHSCKMPVQQRWGFPWCVPVAQALCGCVYKIDREHLFVVSGRVQRLLLNVETRLRIKTDRLRS